jgi:hypothetical protein
MYKTYGQVSKISHLDMADILTHVNTWNRVALVHGSLQDIKKNFNVDFNGIQYKKPYLAL